MVAVGRFCWPLCLARSGLLGSTSVCGNSVEGGIGDGWVLMEVNLYRPQAHLGNLGGGQNQCR